MIATNRNDVLHRLLTSGTYAPQTLEQTLSPSMDITVSSNFERLMFDLYDRDPTAIAALMAAFNDGAISLSQRAMAKARERFTSHRVDDAGTTACIAEVFNATGYLLDPHSAIGFSAARAGAATQAGPWVTLATAHPAKFPDAIASAGVSASPELPLHLADLFVRDEHFEVLPNDLEAVQRFMAGHLGA
jgi:threonine synthase